MWLPKDRCIRQKRGAVSTSRPVCDPHICTICPGMLGDAAMVWPPGYRSRGPPPLPWQVRRQSCPVPLTTSSTFTISYTRFTATNGHSAQGEAQRRQMLTAAPANLNTSRSKGGPAEVEDQASRTWPWFMLHPTPACDVLHYIRPAFQPWRLLSKKIIDGCSCPGHCTPPPMNRMQCYYASAAPTLTPPHPSGLNAPKLTATTRQITKFGHFLLKGARWQPASRHAKEKESDNTQRAYWAQLTVSTRRIKQPPGSHISSGYSGSVVVCSGNWSRTWQLAARASWPHLSLTHLPLEARSCHWPTMVAAVTVLTGRSTTKRGDPLHLPVLSFVTLSQHLWPTALRGHPWQGLTQVEISMMWTVWGSTDDGVWRPSCNNHRLFPAGDLTTTYVSWWSSAASLSSIQRSLATRWSGATHGLNE